ncbi:MAG: transposase [Candidatus Caenarcaniphilales bacterium]|nr:transposase [Candidatus Caenarcaniphilales bacterium]
MATRKNIRLPNYDYSSPGAYFVTVCSFVRESIFGEVQNDEMFANEKGQIVEEVWKGLPKHYHNIELDEFVVMPNHFHGILKIIYNPGDGHIPSYVGAHHDEPAQSTYSQNPSSLNTRLLQERVQHAEPLHKEHFKKNLLSNVIRSFKAASTKAIREVNFSSEKIWQRNYYERIIRSDDELKQIQEYIKFNPLNWALDQENNNKSAKP